MWMKLHPRSIDALQACMKTFAEIPLFYKGTFKEDQVSRIPLERLDESRWWPSTYLYVEFTNPEDYCLAKLTFEGKTNKFGSSLDSVISQRSEDDVLGKLYRNTAKFMANSVYGQMLRPAKDIVYIDYDSNFLSRRSSVDFSQFRMVSDQLRIMASDHTDKGGTV